MSKSGGFDFSESQLVLFGALALGAYVVFKGGINGAAAAAGEAAVNAVANAAQGAATGAVNAIGSSVGLPTSRETTDDPYISRWIMDADGGGKLEASRWSTSSAFINALTIAEGDGVPPVAGSKLASFFPRSNIIDMGHGENW